MHDAVDVKVARIDNDKSINWQDDVSSKPLNAIKSGVEEASKDVSKAVSDLPRLVLDGAVKAIKNGAETVEKDINNGEIKVVTKFLHVPPSDYVNLAVDMINIRRSQKGEHLVHDLGQAKEDHYKNGKEDAKVGMDVINVAMSPDGRQLVKDARTFINDYKHASST